MKKLAFLMATLFVTSLMAESSEGLYKKCAACHGLNGEKKALNRSKPLLGMNKETIVASLKGYKDGSYGGAMKGLMKGQVASLSDVDIKKVSEYISTFK
jgi:cytochrome c553